MSDRKRRRALTLVELLVVIAIISTVAALSAATTLKFLGVQQVNNTRTTLAKLQGQVEARWAEVTRRARDESIPEVLRANPDFAAMAGDDARSARRARVIYVKLRQRQAFPMTFDEALNPYPLPPLAPYVTFLRGLGVSGSTPTTQPFESAVCLLMALERAPGDGGVKPEDMGLAPLPVTLPGGVRTPCLVDARETPLAFCRWPTGCVELNPGGPSPGWNDACDPEGLLNVPGWLAGPGAALFRRLCHDVPARPANAGPSSYFATPMLASAGPDRRMDLLPATLLPAGAGANDNLYAGGR
jgi:prepilin-type N-terminal cleavage/methylation domain-containing protein